MEAQTFRHIVTAALIGLFIGANLGVVLMCVMRMASPDKEPHPSPRDNGKVGP